MCVWGGLGVCVWLGLCRRVGVWVCGVELGVAIGGLGMWVGCVELVGWGRRLERGGVVSYEL